MLITNSIEQIKNLKNNKSLNPESPFYFPAPFFQSATWLTVCNIRLDPALIRPGRVDIKEYIGHCSAHQIEQMFFRFYRIDDTNLAHKLSAAILALGKPVSAAQIQGFFMLHKHSTPDAILENVSRLWEYS